MAITKDNEVSTNVTGDSSRPQPVALEVSVTVNGARAVEGSDKREPFSESTKTVLVFSNGAVIRLASPVAPGQLLFLTNEKTRKEVVCQVVKSKNYRNVSGYVELEFTEPVVGFWGMRFPGEKTQPIAPLTTSTPSPNATTSIPPVNPVAKAPEAKPVVIPPAPVPYKPEPQVSAPVAAAPIPPKPQVPQSAPQMQSSPAPVTPIASNSAPSSSDSETEALRIQAARLQEQLSSMLFTETPGAKKPAAPPVIERKPVASVPAPPKVVEFTASEPIPARPPAPPKPVAQSPASLMDTGEVKIPAWLEPLARNTAASAPVQEAEKGRRPAEHVEREEFTPEPVSVAAGHHEATEITTSSSRVSYEERHSTRVQAKPRNSGKSLLIGAVAAGIICGAATVGWFMHRAGTSSPTQIASSSSPSSASSGNLPAQPSNVGALAPAAGIVATSNNGSASAAIAPVSNNQPIRSTSPSSAPARNSQPPAQSRSEKNERNAKSAGIGDVRMAAPMVNRNGSQDANDAAPVLGMGSTQPVASSDALGGLSTSKQPVAPGSSTFAPASSSASAGGGVGGDVKPAKLLSSASPVYPTLAKNQHVGGDVKIDALVDATGRVTAMKVITGPTLLHQAAMDALRQWRYQPATLDGKPVPMHVTVTLQFRLQ